MLETNAPVAISTAVEVNTDEWNFIVTDVCAQTGILSTRVPVG
jgi:hypothetical protein